MSTIKLLFVVLVLMPFATTAKEALITLQYGVDESGQVTKYWTEFADGKAPEKQKKLTKEETEWANLIAARLRIWQTQLEQIAVPYASIDIPNELYIVVGNRGGRDAFAYPEQYPSSMFFNLAVLAKSYGSGKTQKNQQRIDRIFAHEFTHLLQYRWSKQNSYALTTHLNYALNESYKEGFGHFRSISTKWKDENGHITKHAEQRLKSLEKVFVERMVSLVQATDEQASVYLKGLSTGPFNKKWGALTVALWLTKEAKGNDEKLVKWVELGPDGIIQLANNHLSDELKTKLNQALSKVQ